MASRASVESLSLKQKRLLTYFQSIIAFSVAVVVGKVFGVVDLTAQLGVAIESIHFALILVFFGFYLIDPQLRAVERKMASRNA